MILDDSQYNECRFAMHSPGDGKYGHPCRNIPYALIRHDADAEGYADCIMWVCAEHYDYCIDHGWHELRRA